MRSVAKRKIWLAVSGAIFLATTGGVIAADMTCPGVEAIRQSPGNEGGFAYAASTDGYEWEGENLLGKEHDLATVEFKEVSLLTAKHLAACDYVGRGDAGFRLTMSTPKALVPANPSAWKSSSNEPPHCSASHPDECSFKEN